MSYVSMLQFFVYLRKFNSYDFVFQKTLLYQFNKFYIFRTQVKNNKELLKKVNAFKAVSIKHNKQTDGVSCGFYVVEVLKMKLFLIKVYDCILYISVFQ